MQGKPKDKQRTLSPTLQGDIDDDDEDGDEDECHDEHDYDYDGPTTSVWCYDDYDGGDRAHGGGAMMMTTVRAMSCERW